MRKDIEIHINTQDLALATRDKSANLELKWIDRPANKEERYLYGEVVAPSNFPEQQILERGLYILIPYSPFYKEMRIRIKRMNGRGDEVFVINPATGDIWFDIITEASRDKNTPLYACQLYTISQGSYYCKFQDARIILYSSVQTDLNITNANTQNKNLLLACIPGNNYRYPLLGVGLVRWINSNIDISGLADTLISEFQDEGTPVISASYNHDLKHLNLILDTSTVDQDGTI